MTTDTPGTDADGTPASGPLVTQSPSDLPWPATKFERRTWRTSPDLRSPSGARPSQADRLLTEVVVQVPPRIARQPLHLAPDTQARCEEAATRISQLESHAEQLAGIGDLLVRTEAVASSKIEHIYAELDDLARATLGDEAGERAKRTMAAARTIANLTDSCNDGAPLTLEAILAAHRELLTGDLLEGEWAGRLRQQQNWIGGSDFTPRNAVHVPPPADQVASLMNDLLGFANRDRISAVAQAAVTHAQFEAIHPFTDGNGRVGRALIGAVLRRRGVTASASVPVAAAMLSDVDAYFDELRQYREGNADSLVNYVAESSIIAADAAVVSAVRIADLPAQWADRVKARKGSTAAVLLAHLIRNPVLNLARARAITGSAPNRIYDALNALQSAEVVDEITGQSRNRIWVAHEVLTEVTELESRVGLRAVPSRRWR